MNLKQLEAFVQVADVGSFSRAAKELYLTQPTISAHISSLEKELGARLFVRNTKEVGLSDDGKLLYGYAKDIVELERKIEEVFGKESHCMQHCITIAASTVPAQYLLPKILAKFSEKYPNEQFKIMETDSAQVVEQVLERTIDLGFTGTVIEKKHCAYIPFYKDELVVITPNHEKFRDYQRQGGGIDWIRREPILMREEGSGTRKEAENQLRRSGIHVEDLNVVASIANQETIKKSVQNGVGVSIISKLAAVEAVEAGKILSFSIPGGDGGRDINVVYNKNYKMSGAAERFIRTVKELYQ